MPTPKDRPSKGTMLQLKIASTYTDIGLRAEIGDIDPELKMRDVTDLDSTSVKKRPAIPDLGKLSGKLWFDPDDATQGAMRALLYNPPADPSEWKVVYNTGDAVPANDAFKGFLTKFKVGVGGPMDTLTADFEIEITDVFTPTAGAAS